jgi:hypothetical protein
VSYKHNLRIFNHLVDPIRCQNVLVDGRVVSTDVCHAGGSVSIARGAIHQLLSIILNLRILVLLPVSTTPYVVIVKNYS